jgi:hypothetical protein
VIYGNGHLQFGNKVQGNLTPNAAGNLSENSLYYNGNQRPLCFANGAYNWPVIGIPDPYNAGSNPAKDRAVQSIWASCNCVNIPTGFHPEHNSSGISIYPNPASEKFSIDSKHPVREICIYSASGKLLSQERGRNISSSKISNLESGIYMVIARTDHSSACFRLIRE